MVATAGTLLFMDTIILDGTHLITVGDLEVMDMEALDLVLTILDGTHLTTVGDMVDLETTILITAIITTLTTEYAQVVTVEETLTTL